MSLDPQRRVLGDLEVLDRIANGECWEEAPTLEGPGPPGNVGRLVSHDTSCSEVNSELLERIANGDFFGNSFSLSDFDATGHAAPEASVPEASARVPKAPIHLRLPSPGSQNAVSNSLSDVEAATDPFSGRPFPPLPCAVPESPVHIPGSLVHIRLQPHSDQSSPSESPVHIRVHAPSSQDDAVESPSENEFGTPTKLNRVINFHSRAYGFEDPSPAHQWSGRGDAFEELSPETFFGTTKSGAASTEASVAPEGSTGRLEATISMAATDSKTRRGRALSKSTGRALSKSWDLGASWFLMERSMSKKAAVEGAAAQLDITGLPMDMGQSIGYNRTRAGTGLHVDMAQSMGHNRTRASTGLHVDLGQSIGYNRTEASMTSLKSTIGLKSVLAHFPHFVVIEAMLAVWVFVEIQFRLLGPSGFSSGAFLEPMTKLRVQYDCVDERLQLWRWVSYQFMHHSTWHLVMNLFVLVVAGIPLERCYGTWRMALMFNIGVLGGTLCYFVSDPHVEAIGMSGGCFALQSMHMAKLLMNWRGTEFRLEKLCFLLALLIAQIVQALLTWSTSMSSHSIHLGGYVAGLCIGVLLGSSTFSRCWALRIKVIVLLVGCGLAAWCVSWWWLMWPPTDIWKGVSFCWSRQVSNATVFGDAEYRCLCCRDATCIERWSAQARLLEVSVRACADEGWLEGWAVAER